MAGLVAARDWLTVYWLPPYAPELNLVDLTPPSLAVPRMSEAINSKYLMSTNK